MPVEIRELIIRAVAMLPPEDTSRPAASDLESEDAEQPVDRVGAPQRHISVDDQPAIIQECVRQVLRILQQQKAR